MCNQLFQISLIPSFIHSFYETHDGKNGNGIKERNFKWKKDIVLLYILLILYYEQNPF